MGVDKDWLPVTPPQEGDRGGWGLGQAGPPVELKRKPGSGVPPYYTTPNFRNCQILASSLVVRLPPQPRSLSRRGWYAAEWNSKSTKKGFEYFIICISRFAILVQS